MNCGLPNRGIKMNKLRVCFFGVVIFPFMVVSSSLFATSSVASSAASSSSASCLLAREKISFDEADAKSTVVKEAERVKEASLNYAKKIEKLSSEHKEKLTKLASTCDVLTNELGNSKVDFVPSEAEYVKQKIEKYKALTSASQYCLHGLKYALEYEGKAVENKPECKSFLNDAIKQDLANVVDLMVINDKNVKAVNEETDPDTPIKNFTSEQLKAFMEKDDFAAVASTKTYYSLMELGLSFMPEYDSEGNNKGFKESNFFGVLRLSNRAEDLFGGDTNWVYYQGLEVAFYSAPIACVDESASGVNSSSGTTSSAGANSSAGEKPSTVDCTKKVDSINGLKFADISNTVNASIFLSALYNNPEKWGRWELGPYFRYGVLNREKKGSDGDSVAKYYHGGIELRLNDFLTDSSYRNGLPKFIFNYAEGSTDDYAGTGLKIDRKLASFNYRLFDNQPVFIGLIVDGGKGPDTIALNLSYGLKASSIFGLFAD